MSVAYKVVTKAAWQAYEACTLLNKATSEGWKIIYCIGTKNYVVWTLERHTPEEGYRKPGIIPQPPPGRRD